LPRLARPAVLARQDPPLLCVLLDEGVLHRPVGTPEVMHVHALPECERETFLAEYRLAVDDAHEPAGWPELRRFLRLWAFRAVAVAEPGYYEARERARAGTGGGMLLEDALRQYRPGA
jgi:hypothetical protein